MSLNSRNFFGRALAVTALGTGLMAAGAYLTMRKQPVVDVAEETAHAVRQTAENNESLTADFKALSAYDLFLLAEKGDHKALHELDRRVTANPGLLTASNKVKMYGLLKNGTTPQTPAPHK